MVELFFVRRIAQKRRERFRLRCKRIQLALCGREMVEQARQHLPLFGHFKIHAAHAVKNAPVAAEQDEIGVAAHQLEHQMLLHRFTHLVRAVEAQIDQPLHRRLGERDDAPARQVLAQQHTEHRRLGRIFHGLLRQMDARMIAGGREQQTAARAGAAQAQQQRVALRLLHLVHAAADQGVRQLTRDGGEK